MYLKELTLNGFKSFAERTRLDLGKGISAIVGPNGCGKSNIADAIRWVLGEQSAKSLRAGIMQDVIFQGSDSRKPINLCEITLVFTECEKELGTAFHEVEITRRVHRDGPSDYFLNGKHCRLKDLQQLFLDTGIGQVSYSFMVQGQVDQILSSNPAERRTIFEEAAGISKYKAQRKEAFNKLALVDANLARVTDVIEEVTRQINSLRRQASKALRYKRVNHRLTHLSLASSAFRYTGSKEKISKLESEADVFKNEIGSIQEIIGGKDADISSRRQKRTELYENLQDSQQSVFDLRSEKEQADNKAEFSALRAEDLKGRISEIEKELIEISGQKKALSDRATGDSLHKQEQLDLMGSSDKTYQERNDAFSSIQDILLEAEDDLEEKKRLLLMTESSITRFRSNATTLEVDLKSYQINHSNLSEELFKLKNNRSLLESNLNEISSALQQRLTRKEQLEKEMDELGILRTRVLDEFRQKQSEIQDADRSLAQLGAELGVLQGLQEKFEGFSEGAKAIMQGQLGSLLDNDAYSVLTKSIKVDPAYTLAIDALLGPAIDSIALKDASRIVPVASVLENKKLGRACLQFSVPPVGKAKNNNVPDWLRPAVEKVDSRQSDISTMLDNLLTDCYFCGNLEKFLAYWEEHPDFNFLLVATTKGELVDRRGLIYGGHGGGQSESYLLREAEIKKLNSNQSKVTENYDILQDAVMTLQRSFDENENTIEEKRQLLMEVAQEVSTLKAQKKGTEESISQNEERATQVDNEVQSLENEREESLNKLELAKRQLADAEAEINKLRENITAAENKVQEERANKENEFESLSEVRLDLAEKRQRLQLLDHGLSEIDNQVRELNQLQLKREQEIDIHNEQIAAFLSESQDARIQSTELEKTLKILMESLDRDHKALLEAENKIKGIEESVAVDRSNLHENEVDHNDLEVQLAEQRSELNYLIEEVRREYDLELSAVNWKSQLWEAGDTLSEYVKVDFDEGKLEEDTSYEKREEPSREDLEALNGADWDGVKDEINKLRDRLHAMGPVNLVAIEEYAELKERHEFLKTQSDDLWNSKEQLLAAIDDINQTSQELFQQTFDQVRKNFEHTFSTLFGGGHSDLKLIDTEDVLESGIDIIARPPGTRMKNLALLSGGQKTLTAVALLFAIYMVKPSPFCMLDELDAPLDDANVERFVKMVKQFTQFSQFLIITHNKRTIASANTIYGITMQEKGVSNVFSMRFNRETQRTETLEAAATTNA